MSNNIPVVIIHTGFRDYLKMNLEISSQYNSIYIIGDNTLKVLGDITNVTYIDINKYRNNEDIQKLSKMFINMSSNNGNLEYVCFERIFILKYFLQENNIERIFHMDSDNILLYNINNYNFQKDVAYCLARNYHKHRMSNSIHVGLLNKTFCDVFIQLYKDIYDNKSKFHLIQDKINYHKQSNGKFQGGGICDMTLYYIIANEKLIDVQNLLEPNNGTVFINNFNNGEGYNSKEQYKTNNNMLEIKFAKNGAYIQDIIENKEYKIMNIHFQGPAKRFLNENLKDLLHKLNLNK